MPEDRVVTVAEASRILGKSPDAVRGLIRRGTLTATRGNDGRPRVLLPQGLATVATVAGDGRETVATANPTSRDGLDGLVSELRDRLAQAEAKAAERIADLEAVADQRAAELLAMAARAAGAEGEARALRDALADLASRLDRAEARLALPWWRRLILGNS